MVTFSVCSALLVASVKTITGTGLSVRVSTPYVSASFPIKKNKNAYLTKGIAILRASRDELFAVDNYQ